MAGGSTAAVLSAWLFRIPRTTPPTMTAAMASTTSHVQVRRLAADRVGGYSAFSAVFMSGSFAQCLEMNLRLGWKKYYTKRNVRYGYNDRLRWLKQRYKEKRYFGPMPPGSTAVSEAARTKSEIRTERVTNRLLDSASKFFMERGFEATSMGEIARYARASKETFYRHFPKKEDLFIAVVIRGAKMVAAELSAVLLSHERPEKALAAFGELFLDRVLSVDSIAFHRIVTMERERFPELMQTMKADGRGRVHGSLIRYLDEQVASGRLRKMDTTVGARQFLDLVAAEMIMTATRCGRPKPNKAQIRQRVKEAIDCFLHGYQV